MATSGEHVDSQKVEQVGGDHYQTVGKEIMHWDYAAKLPYLEGMATKYIDRHQKKGGREDLLKARSYIDKMLELYYPRQSAQEVMRGDKERGRVGQGVGQGTTQPIPCNGV